MRGLRFHLFPQRPNYIRGVGLDVFAVFRKTMAELGWVVQFFCDIRMLAETAAALCDIAREMTVIIDHLGMVPAARATGSLRRQRRSAAFGQRVPPAVGRHPGDPEPGGHLLVGGSFIDPLRRGQPHLFPSGALLRGQPTTLGIPHDTGIAQATSTVSRVQNFRR